MAEPWDDLGGVAPLALAPPRRDADRAPTARSPARSLAAVVAIMTFLAALTTGAVMMVVGTASDWQSDVGREVTIQVRPAAGRDIEADVRKAAEIARATPGIADVRAYTKQESARLVEPWLGSGLSLDDLPIPRLIVVKLASGARPDFAALRQTLAAQVAGASLDDHRGWIDRMRTMAGTAVAAGVAILALVLAVTVLSVTFATRGAMATNRPIVEVLHYVGATDGFIASQFQRHFLLLGFKGGAIGGGAGDRLLRRCGSGQRLACRDCGRRPGRRLVRQRLHRRFRLSRDPHPGRTDGHGDGARVAADRQSYPGDYGLRLQIGINLPPESRL